MQRAGAAHAAHHFVENQEHAIAVADVADMVQIVRHRRHGASRRADDRFGNESHDRLRSELDDLVFQRLCRACGIILVALARLLEATGEAWVDLMRFDEQRPELSAAPFVAAGRQRAERVAIHPGKGIYTYWNFSYRGGYDRSSGLRMDHLLTSPSLAAAIRDAGVDVETRGWEKPSDHAPAWIDVDR